MKRRCALAVAGLLIAPALLAAQDVSALPPSRFSITPFVGGRIGYTARTDLSVSGPDGSASVSADETRAGGASLGAEFEVRATGPLSIVGSLAYSWPGDITGFGRVDEGPVQPFRDDDAPSVWFAKAGVSLRLPEPAGPDNRRFRPVAFLTAGPALVREVYDDRGDVPAEWTEAVNNWALNFGAKAVAPLWSPRAAFQLGLEDYFTFWNTGEWERRFTDSFGGPTVYDVDPSHILMVHAGVSFRF